MAISLQKGQKVDLTKTNPNLSNVTIGLGWDVNKFNTNQDFDLDSSVFLLTTSGRVSSELDFVFYNNPQGGNGAVVHCGDNLTGIGDGDDEQVRVDLAKVPAEVAHIMFVVTIHEAEARRQNFGQVSRSYIRVFNEANGQELLRYDLGEDFSIETAVIVGELYRHNNEWKFAAIGSGFSGGLKAVCEYYGLQIG
jgi:tellurium resistance protein TerD